MLDRKETKCEWCNYPIFGIAANICPECGHDFDFEQRYQMQRAEMNKWGCPVYEFRQSCKWWGIRFGIASVLLLLLILATTLTRNLNIMTVGMVAFLPLLASMIAGWFCLLGWTAQAPRKRY